jgi:integrase
LNRKNHINNDYDSDPTAFNHAVGGITKKWKAFIEGLSESHMEHINPQLNGEDMVKQQYVNHISLNVESFKNPYILDQKEYQTQQELFDAIKHWWIFRRRNFESTIKSVLAIARRMSVHPVLPVDWLKFDVNQIIAYLEHREYIENASKCAVKNEWKAVKTFARAYGIDPDTWGYIPPSIPKAKKKIVPLPETVYKITSHKYHKNKYTNALIQYILYHGFLLGFRPSEIAIQKVSDLYLDEGYIIIKEPKKHNQERQVFPEKELLTFGRRKSYKNWLKWRSKVENQYSKDFLYIQSNGKPFTKNYLRKIITTAVKPVWEYFSLYTMRHWCAIARLIKSKVKTGRWDVWEVKEFLGHDDIKTTDQNYIRYADKYYRIASYDWINALLKFHKENYIMEQQKSMNQNSFISKNQKTPKKPLFRVELTGVEKYGSAGI